MTTMAEIDDAQRSALKQRLALAKLLRIDPANATPEDLELANRVMAARSDGASYDKALGDAAVNELFRRGVLFFGGL